MSYPLLLTAIGLLICTYYYMRSDYIRQWFEQALVCSALVLVWLHRGIVLQLY